VVDDLTFHEGGQSEVTFEAAKGSGSGFIALCISNGTELLTIAVLLFGRRSE
jgi:hypothetical protein